MKVAGHLQEKKGYYYAVLSYKDENGKRKTKWISTGLPLKGNKKKAEEVLNTERMNFELVQAAVGESEETNTSNMLFADFMIMWLDTVKPTITASTYSSYSMNVNSIIAPYFRKKGTKLIDLQPIDIQEFYSVQLKRVKPNSVIRYHANIRKALCYALKMDMIQQNPIYKVEKPRKNTFIGSFYDSDELNSLFAAVKDTIMEIPVLLGGFYGFRRSEVVGLRWSAINFEANTLTINHTVTTPMVDGKKQIVAADRAKNKSSLRTLPLVLPVKKKLLALQERQKMYRKKFKGSYNKKYLDYVCVDEMGNLILPNYITSAFGTILKNNGFRKIRYHDLRHTAASMLLANGVSMKEIQEWLGHSDFSTTANIYSHLDYNSKLVSANTMLEHTIIE